MKNRVLAAPLLLTALAALAPGGVAFAQWNACGVPVCTNRADQRLPATATDNAGGAIIAWADQRDTALTAVPDTIPHPARLKWMIFTQRVNSAGVPQWTANGVRAAPDTLLADSLADQQSPAIIDDGAGGAFIAWVDGREYPYTDIYAQHVNANGTPLWGGLLGGIGVCKAVNVQQNPTLVRDGAGGVIVVWQDCRNGVNFDIYAQRVSGTGVPQWTANGVPLCQAPDSQLRPLAIPDGNGGAIVTWYDDRYLQPSFGSADVFAQRVDATGAVLWATDGVPLFGPGGDDFFGDQILPTITSDGAGGAIIACQDSRSVLNYDIYAQRLSASGAQLWSDQGVAVCTAANGQYNPTLCPDGAGGAIITWEDRRKGANYDIDIYAQRVDASGTTQWTFNGAPVCTSAPPIFNGNQQFPDIVADGSGGAILVWYDERGASPSFYTQRLNASGAPLWALNGVNICGTGFGPSAHSVIPDGAGGAIVSWQDARAVGTDIYAARVDNNGGLQSVLGVNDLASAGPALGAPSPNPTTREMSVRFVLAAAGTASIDLLDVAGRRIEHHDVGSLGPGAHTLQLGRESRLHGGLYFIRLRTNDRSLYAKATVVP